MKINPLLISVVLLSALMTATAQTTVQVWQAKAVELYPDLAVKESALNLRFLAIYKDRKQSNPSFFDNPRWPLLLAKEAATSNGAIASDFHAIVNLDQPPGFRDLTFGQDQAIVNGLSKADLDPKDNVQYFKRDSDILSVENLNAAWIFYGFKEGKLHEVRIDFAPPDSPDETTNIKNETAAIDRFTKIWGEPVKLSEKVESDGEHRDRYTWKGEKALAVLVCMRVRVQGYLITLPPSLIVTAR